MRVAAAFAAALLLATAGPVWAATLSVSPIRLVLTPGAPLGTFTIVNEGPEPTRVQLTMNSWRQDAGKDILTPTRDVLINPTIFEVAGNSRQLVRLGLQVPVDKVERSYRLVVDEIPGAAQNRVGTIGVRLRILVPLFVPVAGLKPELVWKVAAKGQDATIAVSNRGAMHSQIVALKVSRAAGGAALFDNKSSVYVLPGASQSATVKLSGAVKPGEELRIDARTDSGTLNAIIRAEGS